MAHQQGLASSLWGTACFQPRVGSLSSFTRFFAPCKTRRPPQLVVLARKRSGFAEILFNKRVSEKDKPLQGSSRERLKRGNVSPRLPVPDHIPRPPYVTSTRVPDFSKLPQIHDNRGIECMRASGRLAAEVLNYAGTLVKPGVTTDEIDKAVHKMIIEAGAYPSPLGYGGFPKSVCTSVNECICHGIPDSRPLQDGDIVNIDVTVYLNGYHGDTSKTYFCGVVDDDAKKLVEVTRTCLEKAIAVCGPGVEFKQIGKAINRSDIIDIVERRWTFMSRPIHAMAAMLHPMYRSPELWNNSELSTKQSDYIGKMFSEDDQVQIDAEFTAYMNGIGPSFSRAVALRKEVQKLPLTWWHSYGRVGLPSLTRLALRVLSQDCSAGACERNWSSYSLVHTKIRNRLSTSQLEKLVYCRANMKLVRSYHAMGSPKQVDPTQLRLVDDPSPEEVDRQIRDEQEEILRDLHRELESVDRRVTRARARALSIPLRSTDPDPESARRDSIRRGKLPVRTSRRRANEAVQLIHTDIPQTDTEDAEVHQHVPSASAREPEFDEEGNVLDDGGLLSSDASSSSSDDDF